MTILDGVKLTVPHVLTLLILLIYIIFGAICISQLEFEKDKEIRSGHRKKIMTQISESVRKLSNIRHGSLLQSNDVNQTFWNENIEVEVVQIMNKMDPEQSAENESHYDVYPALYLNMITWMSTCGYDYFQVKTYAGMFFSMTYIFVGIPLFFLNAANLGLLFEEALLFLLNDVNLISRKGRKHFMSLRKSNIGMIVHQYSDDLLLKRRKGSGAILAVVLYFSILCSYCCIGAAMFMYWEGYDFITGFHFAFGVIATLGIIDIVPGSYLYLSQLFLFIVGGLAIISCYVDLASEYLIECFAKLHYFGRPRPPEYQDYRKSDLFIMLPFILGATEWRQLQLDHFQEIKMLATAYQCYPFVPRTSCKWEYIDESARSDRSIFRRSSFQSDMTIASRC